MALLRISPRTALAVLLILFAGSVLPAATADVVVTPQWLAARLDKEPIVLFHLGDKAEYDAGHIPGAQFLTLPDVSDPAAGKLNLQMAAVDRLRDVFEAHGVSDATRIVLYFGKDRVTMVARVFVALDYLGLADRTSILDGGLPAWKSAGHPLSTEVPTVKKGSLTPHPHPDVIVNADWVSAHLKDPAVTIIDARTPDFYAGSEANSRFPRPGHIPGATNVPYLTLNTEAPGFLLKDLSELRAIFAAAGAKPGAEVVTYCHIGQQASQAYVAAKLLGYRVHLYDGSFEEWSALPDRPVEKGPAPIKK
jgi:thiosulfate/3-mercaptopyruvate sulfurtransferase